MNIIVCYKVVPEEQDINVNPDRTLSIDKAEPKISQYDLNALEAAVQIAEANEGITITAMSVGGKMLESSKARKDMLSRGPDSLSLVIDDSLSNLLPYETASLLAAAASKAGYDLILCGEGSADLYAQQTGLLLGEMLGVPTINAISSIKIEGGKLIAERTLENEVEELEIPLPAVISVTSDINNPRIPGMRSILAAGKKPVNVIAAGELGVNISAPAAVLEGVKAPESADRKNIIVEGDSDDAVAAFFENIRKAI